LRNAASSAESSVADSHLRESAERPASLAIPLTPLLTSVLAGLAIVFTPIVIWRLRTGAWVCLSQPEIPYYLQIAAQAYYNHLFHISDPTVPGGVTFYPWLVFVPVVVVARTLGLSIYSIVIMWSMWAGVGVAAGLYIVYWHFLRRRWLAAGLTIFCLSEIGFGYPGPFSQQVNRLLDALVVHPYGHLRPSELPFWHWRVPNPALDLPFLFLQVVVLSVALDRPTRRNLWFSGLTFGLLFYVYFYLWTLVAAALCIALLLDWSRRKGYAQTLLIGLGVGIPQLVENFRWTTMASADAMNQRGMFAPATRWTHLDPPYFSLLLLAIAGFWIWRIRKRELVFLWSLYAAGIALSRSSVVTGIYLHGYHWDWLWLPIRMILILLLVASSLQYQVRPRPLVKWVSIGFVTLYLASAIYLAAIDVTRTRPGVTQLDDYIRYQAQRQSRSAPSLAPSSVIAGSYEYCNLAAITDNQRILSGHNVQLSMAIDNSQSEARYALNAYLEGVGRAEYEQRIQLELEPEWKTPWNMTLGAPELRARYIRDYERVRENPERFIEAFNVRYVVLPAGQPPPAYLRSGWQSLQREPYWQIWERKRP
jgi:hypothetical protein